MPILYFWSESDNVIPQGSTAIHGDDDSIWKLPQPVPPPPASYSGWQFDQQDMPSSSASLHYDVDPWFPPYVLPVAPVVRTVWLDEQGEMPLLQTVDDGGVIFYTAITGGVVLLDPGGWAQDEVPQGLTPTIDGQDYDILPRLAVQPVPPVLPVAWVAQDDELVPQPSATIDEVHGAFPPGFPPVIPGPAQPVIWLYEQNENPNSLFGQHDHDGMQPFPYKIPEPVRFSQSWDQDWTQAPNVASEEDGEWYTRSFLLRTHIEQVWGIRPGLHGWDTESIPRPFVLVPPSPTSLVIQTRNTEVVYIADNGAEMPSPVSFSAGETGPYLMAMVGSNGARENLSGATVTLVVQSVNGGTPVVNHRQIPVVTASLGIAEWDRQDAEVAKAGDFMMQTTVKRSDGTVGRYLNGGVGDKLTILPALGG